MHPSRLAVSGQTQVPEYSSKCKPAVHVFSIALPSMQLKKVLQTAGFGWAKNPFLRGHFSLVPFGGSKILDTESNVFCFFICFPLFKMKFKTYGVQYGHRSQHWTVGHICSSNEWYYRKQDHLGTIFRLPHHRHTEILKLQFKKNSKNICDWVIVYLIVFIALDWICELSAFIIWTLVIAVRNFLSIY